MKPPKCLIPTHFDNKRLVFTHLNSILYKNDFINCFPEGLWEDEVPSTVYSRSNTIRNNIFSYQNTVSNINPNDTRTYGMIIISCNYTYSKYLNHHHGHIITRDLQIIESKKLHKIIREGPNYREPKTIN